VSLFGYFWLFWLFFGYFWLFLVIFGYFWLFLVISVWAIGTDVVFCLCYRWYGKIRLERAGFVRTHDASTDCDLWVRPRVGEHGDGLNPDDPNRHDPVVFLHGLGVGPSAVRGLRRRSSTQGEEFIFM